jgi:hypothetical protein
MASRPRDPASRPPVDDRHDAPTVDARTVDARTTDARAGTSSSPAGAAAGGAPDDESTAGRYAFARTPGGRLRPSAPVRCPICLDQFAWTEADLYRRLPDNTYAPIDTSRVRDDRKRADLLLGAWKLCPNPSRDMADVPHYLPVEYARGGPPLVVGLVGQSESGKTHLLASMIAEIERGGLAPLGLTATPVDVDLHRQFLRARVDPLFRRGEVIPHTVRVDPEAAVSFADALQLEGPRRQRTVTFFDVAGDDLLQRTRSMNFVLAVDALIFVVDLDPAGHREGPTRSSPGGVSGDPAFDRILSRLRGQSDLLETVATATVVAKADRWRFDPPVSRWIRRPELAAYQRRDGRPDAEAIERESRDAYAFLFAHDAVQWLRPFETFRHSTLHFASATGSGAVTEARGTGEAKVFRRGVRPRRVLDPLAAILAMTGFLGDEAAKVVGS